MPFRAYAASIHVSAGHAPGARPEDWTEVTVNRTVQAGSRAGAIAVITLYARINFNLGALIDHEHTRVTIDASLIEHERTRSSR